MDGARISSSRALIETQLRLILEVEKRQEVLSNWAQVERSGGLMGPPYLEPGSSNGVANKARRELFFDGHSQLISSD